MRKILSIVLFAVLSLPLTAGIHTYADRSVLADGKWVKVRVSESGVCRMSFSELRSAGLNPEQVRVFGYGGAQKEQDFSVRNIDDLPQVPVFTGEDYILFYVQGPISWAYDEEKGRFVHTRNTYSDFGYYMLTDNTGSPMGLPESAAVSGSPTDVTSYPLYQVQDKDSINLIDRNGVSGGGRTFYGEQFTANKKRSFVFSTPGAIEGGTSYLEIDLAANAPTSSYFSASLNGGATKNVSITSIPDHYTFGCAGMISMSGITSADKQEVELQLQNSSTGALGWLNYIEITTPCELKMNGSWTPVRTLVNLDTSVPVRFRMTGADVSTQVWDITRLDAISRMPVTFENDELTWTGTQADGVHEYVAVKPGGNQFVKAQIEGEVKNQNLHALNNIDYVIICPEGYEEVATDLAKAHEEKEGITWAVVTDQQVYNEFSSGTPDATSYRWLMKMLYDRADGNGIAKPRWLLLMGHGSFDNRKLLLNSGSNLLLTYQSLNSLNEVKAYATDDYFGFLDDNEGTNDIKGRMDIGVGRLPVESVSEARTTVDKLIRYIRNEQTGK